MENYRWSKFIKRITVKAEPAEIYKAWATPAGLEKWFLRKAAFTTDDGGICEKESYIQKDDTYEWLWHGYPDFTLEKGKILEANGKDFLQFTFTGGCIVSISVKAEEDEIIVELTQENIPDDKNPKTNLYVACGEGWTFYLTNLKSVLEGGIDLRNKNADIKSVVNS